MAPDMLGGGAVEDGDSAQLAAAGFAGVHNARAMKASSTVMTAIDLEAQKGVAGRGRSAGVALPVGRAAQKASAAVIDFVDIVGRQMQVGLVEHHVVGGVFGILHGAENGVGAAMEHHVKGAEVDMALIAQREEEDETAETSSTASTATMSRKAMERGGRPFS